MHRILEVEPPYFLLICIFCKPFFTRPSLVCLVLDRKRLTARTMKSDNGQYLGKLGVQCDDKG